MKIKTSELEGAALDWAVANAVGQDVTEQGVYIQERRAGQDGSVSLTKTWVAFSPSTNWSQGGPLIERYCMPLDYNSNSDMWAASVRVGRLVNSSSGWVFMSAPTPLVAACRAIVAAKLGDVVDVPEELV